jgi:TonB-linked SusC/RagA family outer membrane protein
MAMIINVQSLTAQSSGTKVSFESKNQSLDQTLKALDKQTTMRISYTVDLVSPYSHISVEKGERSIESTLNLILANTNLTYEIKGDNILIIKKQDKSSKPTSEKSSVTASGKVTDKEGTPLAGVTVISQSSKAATITDYNGNYSIQVPKDDVVAFSFIGLEKKLIKIANTQTLNVTLSENVNVLDEVQVIGYGTTTRRLKTSGVATIKEGEIANQATSTNFLQSMQGKLSGVAINQTGGGIGTSSDIYIRGINSIKSGNDPLYIVDGVIISNAITEFNTGLTGNAKRNALSSINQADIVSIDVLKDADATAIYGSRGANGVVLITTKKAETGKSTFTLDASTGFNNPITTKYLNLEQYLSLRNEAFTVQGVTPTAANAPDLLTWSQTEGKDWTKELNKGSGSIYNINGTLTGGTKSLSYLASIGYNETHDTYLTDPYDKKVSGKLNLNHTSDNNKFKASFSSSFSNDNYSIGVGSLTSTGGAVYLTPPNFPVTNADGSYIYAVGSNRLTNAFASNVSSNKSKTVDYLLSSNVSYELYKGLVAKIEVSYNYLNSNNIAKLYLVSIPPTSRSGMFPGVTETFNTFTSFNVEPQITYATTIGKGKLDALLGSTWFSKTNEIKTMKMTDYLTEDLFDSYSSAGTTKATSSYSPYYMRSWFGRVNYNWDNRYIVNITYRADGSSRFDSDNRWGNFGALGGAWIYTNEKFVKSALPWLSYGKLRASYGVTGNDNIPDFQYIQTYSSSVYYNGTSALTPNNLPNKDITWERTRKLEVALENSFFNDRLSTSVAYFFNRTTKMLLPITIAGQTGFTTIYKNFDGIVDNKGWEVEINSTNVKTKHFSWRTALNVTFQKNMLTKKPAALTSTYFEGKPISAIAGPKFSRIDPDTGNALWINATTGAEQSTVDWTNQYLGSFLPTVFGGLTNSLNYKGITLDFTISFARKMMTNALQGTNLYPGYIYNVPSIILGKYWQKPGDEAVYPKLAATSYLSGNLTAYNSGPTLNEGFYFKMQNIALSYALPSQWIAKIGGQSAAIYVRGQNLFYVTPGNNLGKDPERNMTGGLNITRSYVLGLNVKF